MIVEASSSAPKESQPDNTDTRRQYYCALLAKFTQPEYSNGMQDNIAARLTVPERSIWRNPFRRYGNYQDHNGSITLSSPCQNGEDLFVEAATTCAGCEARVHGECNPVIGPVTKEQYNAITTNERNQPKVYPVDLIRVGISATDAVEFPYPHIAGYSDFEEDGSNIN